MVTVETAMVLPLLIVFALVAVAAIGVAQARLRCVDVAREAARAAARNQSISSDVAQSVQIATTRKGGTVTATARVVLQPVGWLPSVTVVESASAAVEPGGESP